FYARPLRIHDIPYGSGTPGHHGLTPYRTGRACPVTTDLRHTPYGSHPATTNLRHHRGGRPCPVTTDLRHTVRVGHTRPLRTYDTVAGAGHADHHGLSTCPTGRARPVTTDLRHTV